MWPTKKKKSRHFKKLSEKLDEKKTQALESLKERHKEVVVWARKKGIEADEVVGKSARGLAAGVATGAMVLSVGAAQNGKQPSKNLTDQKEIRRDVTDLNVKAGVGAKKDITPFVKKALSGVNMGDEKKISRNLSDTLQIPVTEQLSGIRLNTTYGIMGYESHLSRYPGDNLYSHFHSNTEFQTFSKAGMAGGPGAWGYLAPNRAALTNKEIEREKYYLVAQTFLSPNWGSASVKQWFRHRKMVVVNPKNGIVVVGVLEDAGPQVETGRSFGGSPEVIEELGLRKTGPYVLMYFVDDPKDQIPLGRYGL
ncbi:MAG: hypothetical protein A2Z11_04910 [Candidatus Woykebacteria bacterium RBG_16_43_9]|uniref:Uncharacterized protein n=1 Tax=Candidatus Woykebacteria bacterium RBG_16_43_9 TaxID=1802596 RepID=A0A1G1WDS9_9BACT|nr:MAG: hypothetical protein A2Z11_04910 [Candidatus Woykebacteria bacterium RBG_16_43_9]